MKLTERHRKILEYLNTHDFATVQELANELECSGSTVRRELNKLDEAEILKRIRGGAQSLSEPFVPSKYSQFKISNWIEKKRIGQAAARLVKDGETIALHPGTTTMALASYLLDKNRLNVVTNDIEIAQLLSNKVGFEVMLIGGCLQRDVPATMGSYSIEMWKSFLFDKVFLGALGLDARNGLMTGHPEHGESGRTLVEICTEAIILADHSKFYKRAGIVFAQFHEISTIITDKGIKEDKSLITELRDSGVRLMIV